MSLRAYTDHVDDYNRTHTIEIHKSGYSGSVDYLKNTGSGYASFDYEKIDPKNPTDNPIQKGALEFSLWLQSSALIDEIKTADEQTFWAVHKVDGTQEWIGYIYNDLSTYEEGFENHPFRITLMAKDFTDLGGKDYLVSESLPDNRERVIATIAYLLDTVGFDMPIKTHTSWIEENLTGDYDYLNEIYHETKALREFGRTGDESDQPITVEDTLNKLCVNHGLLLKQANGAYWIDQLTEYETPTSVQEATYDLTGTQTAFSTTNDLTVDANTSDLKVTIQQDNRDNSGLPGIKRVKNKYDHRTDVGGIEFPSIIEIPGNNFESYSQAFISDGSQKISLDFSVRIESPSGNDSITIDVELKAGGYWWDNDNGVWKSSQYINTIDAVFLKPLGSDEEWRTGVDFDTTETPTDADGFLEVIIDAGVGDSVSPSITEYIDGNINILNPTAEQNSVSINYQLSQTDNYSVVSEIEDTIFGDGPNAYTVGALRHGSADDDITVDTWQRKGSTAYRNFHHNLLAEHLDVRRGWRRLLSATLKGLYYPWQILSYDSEYFYFLGGSWDLFTGNWEGELFSLDIQTGSDTFQDIPKFSDESGTGTASGGSSGGGLDQSTADSRYFKQASNLSEGDPATMQSNLGLTDASADLDLNSLSIDGDNLFSLFYTEQEINSFFDLYYSKADLTDGGEGLNLNSLTITNDSAESVLFDRTENQSVDNTYRVGVSNQDAYLIGSDTGQGALARFFSDANVEFYGDTDVDGAFSATSLRSDSGKFLSPTAYAFRNAGDTGFRDVEMAGLTATTAIFDGKTEILNNNFLQWNNAGADTGRFRSSYNGGTGRLEWDFFRSDNDSWETILEFPERSDPDNTEFLFHKPSKFNEKVVLDGDILYTTDSFSSGFLGSGARHDLANSEYNFETDVGRFRSALFATEFIVKQIRALSGSDHLSAGAGKVDNILDASTAGSEVIEVSDPEGSNYNPFAVNDIILCLQVRNDLEPNTVNVLTDDDPVITKRYVRAVDFINGDNVGFKTVSGAPNDAGSIEEGDVLVAIGNLTDSNRQDIIYRSVIERNSPFVSIKSGIDSWNAYKDNDNEVLHYGNLNGSYGYNGEIYGFAAGDPQGDHFTIESSNGLRFKDGSGNIGAQFSSSVLTIGDGFSYDAASNVLDVAAFTVTDKWLTDGQTYIGTDMWDTLGAGNREEKVYIGDPFNEGSGSVQVRGTEDDTFAIMRSPRNSTDYMFRANYQGNNLFQVGLGDNRIAGSYFDATDLWGYPSGYAGDTSDKSNASVRLDFDEGAILYDAMGSSLNAKFVEAGFGENNAPSLIDEEWFVENEVVGDETTNSFVTPIRGRYKHKYGINELTLNAQSRETLTVDSGSYANTGRIYIRVLDQEGGTVIEQDFIEISGSSYQSFTLTLDISSLTAGNYYVVEVDCWSQTSSQSGTNDATDSASSRTYIREDYYLDTSTG